MVGELAERTSGCAGSSDQKWLEPLGCAETNHPLVPLSTSLGGSELVSEASQKRHGGRFAEASLTKMIARITAKGSPFELQPSDG